MMWGLQIDQLFQGTRLWDHAGFAEPLPLGGDWRPDDRRPALGSDPVRGPARLRRWDPSAIWTRSNWPSAPGSHRWPLPTPRKARADILAVGWAVVETERAATELGGDWVPEPDDRLLGASVRRSTGRPTEILLLEPNREGRLAGALARHGEGPIALYLGAVDGAGAGPSRLRAGTGRSAASSSSSAVHPAARSSCSSRIQPRPALERVPSEP